MTDLINQLRTTASKGISVWGDLQMEAANRIEMLTEERDALTSKLELARMKTYCASISDIAKERDALKDAARLALDALEVVEPFINTNATACRGDKCREPWCASCNTEEEAEASAHEGYRAAVNALSAIAALKAVL